MATPSDPRRIERVMLACVQCRSRHVKCDATQPTCNRCKRDGKDCTFQKSRRGGLDKAALARRRLRLQQEKERAQEADANPSNSEFELCSPAGSSSTGDSTPPATFSSNHVDSDVYTPNSRLAQPGSVAFRVSEDRLLELFFENFWPSFPCILPYLFLQARRMNNNHGMHALLPVLYWIGSIYAPWTPSEPYFEAAIAATRTATLAHTPFNVQALMFYAIALYHCDVKPEGREKLDAAVGMALRLRMNERWFARAYGETNPVLEESWRRTYYLLKIADQHFSIISNMPMYTLLSVPSDVDLPCDDEHFESGVSQ
ncbi:hypothetical protein J1614_002051 [Plenodomus biglobosus]|nr:hypothetical protein J1614_002051 [Plenodomus biglobosus]